MLSLKDAMVDHDVLALGDINGLKELSSVIGGDSTTSSKSMGKSMILFGDTTSNLDLLPALATGQHSGKSFNLFSVLNHTSTAFGKRLLRQWVCNPLLREKDIVERQQAVEDLFKNKELVADAKKAMKKMCDFEKCVSAIFAAGQKKENHPNSEAIFYETEAQIKRNINHLVSCLKGFESALKLLNKFKENAEEFKSGYLKRLCERDFKCLGELQDICESFRNAFDYADALEKNRIVPVSTGVDEDYDEVVEKLEKMEKRARKHLKEQCEHFGTKEVNFWGTAKNIYQLEVPERQAQKHAGSEHTLSSQKKGFKRYLTPTCEELRETKTELEEEKRGVFEKIHANMFNRFCTHRALWRKVVQLLSNLDCLLSLAEYSYGIAGDSCFPMILDCDREGGDVIEIVCGKHPLLESNDFIPNDVSLCQKVFILTGANMGGKSTVMRQTALLVVLAQIGCRVPAESMQLTPVDRVFSRMGANDNIMEGKSTFFVEMAETSNILEHVTSSSLVVCDELGRGTTTHDGCAIAGSVIDFLAEKKCRTIFRWNSQTLVNEFSRFTIPAIEIHIELS
jgi:DNA mismatch repair protein MSH6